MASHDCMILNTKWIANLLTLTYNMKQIRVLSLNIFIDRTLGEPPEERCLGYRK